ncbi:hypothetical protein CCAX7_39280 [Capsulimonas corticalis]|uniref:Uncharacterized protein n=1 Tax=Capsulimonas corticalis TaxID=2219043 RepID=A0A402D3J4_9BACT|nr:prepilin-type N-terminal cleavage/methylation domain-containing protein [Capsulimonas corticalis]BDI31877.1 hypothetical protein CCAX7_39280 [Capsulimonas corticalis]
MKRVAGMTIGEVAIVLVILAVMAAILFPVFAKAGEYSGPGPYSNPKQIGLAMLQYAEDNEQMLPPRQSYSGPNHELVSWRSMIYPYLRSNNVYESRENAAAKEPDLERDTYHRSYAVNSTTVAKLGASGPFSDVYGGTSRIKDIPNPATVALLTETTAAYNDINVTLPEAFTAKFVPGQNRGALFMSKRFHVSAYLFADGHVRGYAPLQTRNVDGKNLWTRDNSTFSPIENAKVNKVLQYAEDHFEEMQRKRDG